MLHNKKLTVNEIFLSINGETTSMGMPTTFIRLAGCNLNCWGGCDTLQALSQDAGIRIELGEIIDQVKALGCPRICVTGGEPLLDRNASKALLQRLLEEGFKEISVETNGSVDLTAFKKEFNSEIRFTMDLKPPSSGMDERMYLNNLQLLDDNDEIKFVVANKKDFSWALEKLTEYQPKAKILFSPMFERIEPRQLVEWVLEEKLWESRVQLQLHKYIWSPDTMGV